MHFTKKILNPNIIVNIAYKITQKQYALMLDKKPKTNWKLKPNIITIKCDQNNLCTPQTPIVKPKTGGQI